MKKQKFNSGSIFIEWLFGGAIFFVFLWALIDIPLALLQKINLEKLNFNLTTQLIRTQENQQQNLLAFMNEVLLQSGVPDTEAFLVRSNLISTQSTSLVKKKTVQLIEVTLHKKYSSPFSIWAKWLAVHPMVIQSKVRRARVLYEDE